jgi:hypothetical protein
MNRLAMTAQANCAWSLNRDGPGINPFIMKAPIRMAVVGEVGMPRVKRGISEALAFSCPYLCPIAQTSACAR